jgi:hypothetical protein
MPLTDYTMHVSVFCNNIKPYNQMCYETQMRPYKANSRGGHHRQNPRSSFQNLQFQYKGLFTSNMHMKYKSPITCHSKDMAKVSF